MKSIFLSASVPAPGREYYKGSNPIIIREAIVAFTRVCMEYGISFYFGGHPAISPLVYQIARNCLRGKDAPIKIYQSEWFRDKTPEEVAYYDNIVWTPKGETNQDSVKKMREQMFEENKNDTCCAVFIGGMSGIIEEAKMLRNIERDLHTHIDKLPVSSTGGASAELYREWGLDDVNLSFNYAYVSVFQDYLLKYKGQ